MQDLKANRNAIPDWHQCQSIVFVYPYKLKDREHLIPFYDKLLTFIPNDVGITLVVKNSSFSKKYIQKCRENGITNNIKFIECSDISDIWIRDFAPLSIMENSLKTAVQFNYAPAYVDKKYSKYLQHDHIAGELIWKHLHGQGVNSVDFNWDIGNLTHNGAGTAIISNRFIADNENRNIEHELKPVLRAFCAFNNIIFIPTEPDDATGHVDGIVRFIDEKILVVGSYPKYSPNHNFMDILADNIQESLGSEYNIIRLENGEPEDFETEGVGSALGNHMNFLRINNTILFPFYNDEISKEPLRKFKNEFKKHELNIDIIPVDMVEIGDLARSGGVLNCISWQVY